MTFSVELPTLITEYIHSTEPRPTRPPVKGISAWFEVVGGFSSARQLSDFLLEFDETQCMS